MARVGGKIKQLREDRGWTQPRLAVEAGVAVSAVSQIETGRRSPNVGTLDKLAGALGVEVVDLFPKEPARIDPGVQGLRRLAHELVPGTPAEEALTRLTTGNRSFLGRALSHVLYAPSEEEDYSGWLKDDPASTMPAIKAAVRFVDRTDSDIETVYGLVENEFTERQIEAGREGQRAAENAGREETA